MLPRAINSVLCQSCTDFELIVVDGDSTDQTRDVVAQYMANDSRVKYIHIPENRSAAACLNIGLRAGAGRFLAILDDDDEFLPHKLEKQIEHFRISDPDTGIVYCWDRVWDDRKNELVKERKHTQSGNLYDRLLYGPCTGASSEMMIRKEVIEKTGGWDESITYGADYQFNLNAARLYKHAFVPEILVVTHWNHEYVHLTTQKGGKVNYSHIVEYYEKILTDHSDGFDQHPEARFWHYRGIISAAASSRMNDTIRKYLILGLKARVPLSVKLRYIFQTTKRLARAYTGI
jgi:glycosyltransferase involved in cell wall biosynthesis